MNPLNPAITLLLLVWTISMVTPLQAQNFEELIRSEKKMYLVRQPGKTIQIGGGYIMYHLSDVKHEKVTSFRQRFVNIKAGRTVQPLHPRDASVIRFRGDATQQKINTYSELMISDLYEGVNLRYLLSEGSVRYDLELEAGVSPDLVRFEVEGVDELLIDPDGNLVMRFGNQHLAQSRPVSFQYKDGEKRMLDSSFVLLGDKQVGFEVEGVDPLHALVIDPTLMYSTYFGAPNNDTFHDVVLDAAGNTYICGKSFTPVLQKQNGYVFPVPDFNFFSQDPLNRGSWDVVVSKISPDGQTVLFSAILGGNGNDIPHGIDVDSQGRVYVVGEADNYFPLVREVEVYQSSPDAFLSILNADGQSLYFSTYLSGAAVDRAYDVKVRGDLVYVVGETFSDENTFKIHQPITWDTTYNGNGDGFLAIVNPHLNVLAPLAQRVPHKTFLGGPDSDVASALALTTETTPFIYITGWTESDNRFGAVSAGIQDNIGTTPPDAFLMRLSQTITAAKFTYLGGWGVDMGHDVAVDSQNHAVVVGETTSGNFPALNAYQDSWSNSQDGFVAKFSPTFDAFVFSTFFGGSMTDVLQGVAIDGEDHLLFVGSTLSANYPVLENLYNASGGFDAVLTRLDKTGQNVLFSTYFGGNFGDFAMAVDTIDGDVVVVGYTGSDNGFPVVNPLQANPFSGDNGFVSRFRLSPPPVLTVSPSTISRSIEEGTNATAATLSISNTGGGDMSYAVTSNQSWVSVTPTNGSSSGETDQLGVLFNTSGLGVGTYPATLTVSAPDANNSPQTVSVSVTINAASQTGDTHPADVNGDFRLQINEVTAYGAAWKTGASFQNPPNPIPLDYVTRAGFLWKQGEQYEDNQGAKPVGWVPVAP